MYNQNPYYNNMPYNYGAMPDNLSQLRSQPMQQPAVQQQMTQPFQFSPAQQNDGNLIWVQGEAGAKAYLVAPNARVILWDTENPTIYIKSADSSGIPSMRILDWTERNANVPAVQNVISNVSNASAIDMGKYVTYEELEKILADFNVVSQPAKSAKANNKKEELSNG